MDPHALAIEYVEPHCDLVERLRALPPSAHVRGVVFTSIKEALRRTGKLEEFGAQFGAFRYESLALYPLAEYMVRLASAGAFLRSPQAVYEGIGEISRLNAAEMTKSLLGQALLHELAAEPERLLEQGLAMRRQVCKYGRWELLTHAPRHVEVRYVDEYVWIRQAWTYAALGTFEGCSIKPRITTTLETPYCGSTHFRW
ncbi:MAG TPA: DUF2378 family protein [Polyangiales bacterium]